MTTISKRLELSTARCEQCGHEMQALVMEGAERYAEARKAATQVEVWIEWKGTTASAGEIAAVRSLVPELAATPVQDLARRAREHRALDLGRMWEHQAIDLKTKAEALGLTIRFAVPSRQ
jgi:hypothetical protein